MIYIKSDRTVSVTKGFSFWGFVFVWGWLLSRGLWLQSFLVMLIYIPVYFFHSIVIASITSSMQLPELYYLAPTLILAAIHIYVGFNGKQWLRAALLRKGYKSIE
jgi:hypothetical protein